MKSDEIRLKFLKFFENRGHKIIPSASLVPENDPSVLFNTAGMQPLVPYLLGEVHPMGKRLVNIQKCVRTQDIDEVGDNTHDTFFEMMGNWSLGDYFKEEAIKWSYEFLTSKDEGLGLDKERLYVTVFEGDENASKDTEAFDIWKKYIPENRIYYMSAKTNWWSVGDNGPCGPDTEMFYDITKNGLGDLSQEEYVEADKEQKVIEIWNDVFMEHEKRDGKVIGKLKQRNVDTGAGLERVLMATQGKDNIFETDLFKPLIENLEIKSKKSPTSSISIRIIADHLRTSVFMINDGVIPFNTNRGYVLRRLLRRIFRRAVILELPKEFWIDLIEIVFKIYDKTHLEFKIKIENIISLIKEEEKKFQKPLDWVEQYRADLEAARNGIVKKILDVPIVNSNGFASGLYIHKNYQTYGVPADLSIDVAKELGYEVDEKEFENASKEHQKLSQTASAGMFKGGLADVGEKSIKYHTATHLLLAALRKILNEDIVQKGSNITTERLRFDFNWPEKVSADKLKEVEDLVNLKIQEAIPVEMQELPKEEAVKVVKNLSFDLSKYGDIVKIYKIGDFSIEFCGGPHVSNTSELGQFKIQKEEAVAQGIRRIKAVLL